MSEKSGGETERNDGVQQLINYGTEILGSGAGGAASAALGLLIGGPGGAVIGGIVGKGV